MKLDNFKELLIKKSGDNENLQLLIKYMRDEYLVDHVVESLEKMAASYSKKNPNASLKDFAANMNKFKSGMIHDALSHHATQYKKALEAGDKNVADDHMRQIFKTMHMIDKITKDSVNDHTGGRLKVEAVDPKPWERSGYQNKNDQGKFKTDTQGWKRHGAQISYDWLRDAPHESYKDEIKRHGHNKAYPLEEITVNDKHIHVDPDAEYTGKYESHPFDEHPIFKYYNQSPSAHTPEHKAKYLEERQQFHENPEGGKAKYREKLAGMSKEDFANFGSKKADPIHPHIEGLDVSSKTAGQPAKIEPTDLKARLERIRQMGKK